MKTKNAHILTFPDKIQISIFYPLCFATCDWFCHMTSQISKLSLDLVFLLKIKVDYQYVCTKEIFLKFITVLENKSLPINSESGNYFFLTFNYKS